MKSLSELRSELAARCGRIGRPVRMMEVCGTHTVAVFRSGLRALFPANLRLISGPGCPVCVTAQGQIDAAVALVARPDVTVATYGDMLRVPGRSGSLEERRGAGGRIRVVTSAWRALELAQGAPGTTVVFLGVGFETTAPATAAVVLEAARQGVENFCVLSFHKRVVPAMVALLEAGAVAIDGFLCPGHVSVIVGAEAYRPVVARFARPCVVAGFEPREIVAALVRLVRQVERGEARLENGYPAVVSASGNGVALGLLARVFEPVSTAWRGLGSIDQSGLALRAEFARFDALRRFGLAPGDDVDPPGCRCGEVICGQCEPPECALFGEACTPARPIGPCMVSGEGTCAAWYRFGGVTPRRSNAEVRRCPATA
ncbi:MAG: hydrogenase formation protein HypD [Phycisphaerae bacterium]